MGYNVCPEIKKSAIHCKKDFICLTRNKTTLCKVISTIDNNTMYVYCQNKESCPYQYQYNERTLCTCPVRKDIYNKYNI